MSQTPPFRSRPDLHLSLTPFSASTPVSRQTSPRTPHLGNTNYSPFRSAGLQPPTPGTPRGLPAQFVPRASRFGYGSYGSYRVRRILTSRALWLFLVLSTLLWWWINGGRTDIEAMRLRSTDFGRDLFGPEITRGLQFFPASNRKIHYVGRWTATPNRLRMDGTFPGVYFDITVNATTTVLLSLNNAERPSKAGTATSESSSKVDSTPPEPPRTGHLSFNPPSPLNEPALPISLLARIDQDEYILLPNVSAIVTVRHKDLKAGESHSIRIIAPMADDRGLGIVELKGIWLDKGGGLLKVEGTQLTLEAGQEDAMQAESQHIGEKHRIGLNRLLGGNSFGESHENGKEHDDPSKEDKETTASSERKKILEVITDAPYSATGERKGSRTGGVDGLLSGVMGWEYVIGEMFGVDHVSIGVEGMCLTEECIGGTGTPAGLGDVFFRSGPANTLQFEHPWMFHSYIPDVMVLNMGGSDSESFQEYASGYNKSAWDLFERFEETYVRLVKSIRTLAYPKHPSIAAAESSEAIGEPPSIAPTSIPIFVMRPLRGHLEHATQTVVKRLRDDGDKLVFWLDTSGWLDPDETTSAERDFSLDESVTPPKWRLTERGNQRVAIFLHLHICRYLAKEIDRCAFLPPEVYQGKVFDLESAKFDRFLEKEKERKLKKLFWNEGSEADEVIQG